MLRVNSKEVNPGDTFLALNKENYNGHDFIEEAIDKGAACIIADHGEYSVKTIITPDTRTYLTNYLREMYIEKLEKIKIIGIAGTSGKTITGEILYQLLNNLDSKTAYLGANAFYIEDKKEVISNILDIYDIYEYINKAIEQECQNIVIEISSSDISQRRIEGLRFDTAIFTNLITKKLNKQSIQDYLNTKIEMFKMIKNNGTSIINKKDEYHKYFVLPQNNNIFYGTDDSEYRISDISLTYDFTEFKINGEKIELPLIGSYNIYNYLAAFVTARSMNFTSETIIEATKNIKPIEGRYQNIKHKDNLIIIDYAYNPELIKNVINYTKEFTHGKIITIIGCDGDRDKEIRPIIGKTVTEESDYVILTTDNPRYETPEDIIDDITKGIEKDNYEIIINRKDAIKKGINLLENNDILLILGKGEEDAQIIGSDRFTFKDYDEVKKYIK